MWRATEKLLSCILWAISLETVLSRLHGAACTCCLDGRVKVERAGMDLMLWATVLSLAAGRAIATCATFRGEPLACDEIEKARMFNGRMNNASFAKVRKAMNEAMLPWLPYPHWERGHACPDRNKKSTIDPEDYGWNIFAQTKSDNGPLGHCLVSCQEARFYNALHVRCTQECVKGEDCCVKFKEPGGCGVYLLAGRMDECQFPLAVETVDDPIVYASEMTLELFTRFVGPLTNKFASNVCNAVGLVNPEQCAKVGDRADQAVRTKVKTFVRTVGQKATTNMSAHVTKMNALSTAIRVPGLAVSAGAAAVGTGIYLAMRANQKVDQLREDVININDYLERHHAVVVAYLDRHEQELLKIGEGMDILLTEGYRIRLNELEQAYSNVMLNQNKNITSGKVWSKGLDRLSKAAESHIAGLKVHLERVNRQQRVLVLATWVLAVTAFQDGELGYAPDDERVLEKSRESFKGLGIRLETEMNGLVDDAGPSSIYNISTYLSPLLAQIEFPRRVVAARADGLVPGIIDIRAFMPSLLDDPSIEILWDDHLDEVRWLVNSTAANLTDSPCENMTVEIPHENMSMFEYITPSEIDKERVRMYLHDQGEESDKINKILIEEWKEYIKNKTDVLPSEKETAERILRDPSETRERILRDNASSAWDTFDILIGLGEWERHHPLRTGSQDWRSLLNQQRSWLRWLRWLINMGIDVPNYPPSSAGLATDQPFAFTNSRWRIDHYELFQSIGIPDEHVFNDGCPKGQVKKVRMEVLRQVVQPSYKNSSREHLKKILETTRAPNFRDGAIRFSHNGRKFKNCYTCADSEASASDICQNCNSQIDIVTELGIKDRAWYKRYWKETFEEAHKNFTASGHGESHDLYALRRLGTEGPLSYAGYYMRYAPSKLNCRIKNNLLAWWKFSEAGMSQIQAKRDYVYEVRELRRQDGGFFNCGVREPATRFERVLDQIPWAGAKLGEKYRDYYCLS